MNKKKNRMKKNQANTVDNNNDKQRAFNRPHHNETNKTIELIELNKHVKRNCVEIQMNYVDVRLVNGEHLVMLKHSHLHEERKMKTNKQKR